MAFSYKDYEESDAVKQARAKAEQYSTYNESDDVKGARESLANHENNKVAEWQGGQYADSVKNALNKLENYGDFKYDLNGDILYQQYKNQYINQGKLAMADTIGQASALTGGYGNSYAATAGNQAYQSYLTKLNDIVPSLYSLALDKYNTERTNLQNDLSMYQSLYNTEYGEHRDKVADWNAEASRLSDRYYNEANLDYTKFTNDRDYFNTNYNNERTYDYNQYADAYNRAFAQYQQQVQEEQFAKQLAASRSSGGSSSGSGSGKLSNSQVYTIMDQIYNNEVWHNEGSAYNGKLLMDRKLEEYLTGGNITPSQYDSILKSKEYIKIWNGMGYK